MAQSEDIVKMRLTPVRALRKTNVVFVVVGNSMSVEEINLFRKMSGKIIMEGLFAEKTL